MHNFSVFSAFVFRESTSSYIVLYECTAASGSLKSAMRVGKKGFSSSLFFCAPSGCPRSHNSFAVVIPPTQTLLTDDFL